MYIYTHIIITILISVVMIRAEVDAPLGCACTSILRCAAPRINVSQVLLYVLFRL